MIIIFWILREFFFKFTVVFQELLSELCLALIQLQLLPHAIHIYFQISFVTLFW